MLDVILIGAAFTETAAGAASAVFNAATRDARPRYASAASGSGLTRLVSTLLRHSIIEEDVAFDSKASDKLHNAKILHIGSLLQR